MGLNVGSISSANTQLSKIDTQALERVTEQIFNPNNEKSIDVSKLDLSKFNRVNIGTDLYAARTSTEAAIQASKAAADYGVNLSNAFSATVQYLNSQAAQSLFTSKENNGKVTVGTDNTQPLTGAQAVVASAEVVDINSMNKDKKGHNPFVYYVKAAAKHNVTEEEIINSKNIFELNEIEEKMFKQTVNILA